jgi:hypothetical protein
MTLKAEQLGNRTSGRRKTMRRAATAGGLAVAVCGAVFGLVATNTSSVAVPKSSALAATPPANVVNYQVAGYTSEQAASAVNNCLNASGSAGGIQGATLRDTAADGSGSTLIITTATGWSTCNESANGAMGGTPYETYATAEGWGTKSTPASDSPASWIMGPVELDSYGGGLISKTSTTGWLDVAVGRAASDVARVTVQMPGGSVVTANVQNGYFIAREVLPSEPAVQAVGTRIPIVGYVSSGSQVYNSQGSSPTADAASASPPCYVTPDGQPVTPSGSSCQTATAW